MKFIQLFILFVFTTSYSALSCTTFVLSDKNTLVFGRNLDWVSDIGLVVVNKRGIQKSALVLPPENPVTWLSKFGSISFNQFGKEFPYGGMNEKGLVIEIMRSKAEYPKSDERPALNELQWVQYQLDNSATINDVIHSDKFIRIQAVKEELHFLVCDQSGAKVVLEFKQGKLQVFRDQNLPLPILANSYYPEDLQRYKAGIPCRFTKVANHLKAYNTATENPIDYSFKILKDVALEGSWSIVYDIKNKQIYFKSKTHSTIKKIDMNKFVFTCNQPAQLLSIQTNDSKDVTTYFKPYNHQLNTTILKNALQKNKIEFPKSIANLFYNYSKTHICTND